MPLPVSDDHHFIGLDQLLLEEVHKLEILLGGHSDHGIQEDLIVSLRELDPGEKIRGDAVKQGDVVGQELGKIDVNDGPQQLRKEKYSGINHKNGKEKYFDDKNNLNIMYCHPKT